MSVKWVGTSTRKVSVKRTGMPWWSFIPTENVKGVAVQYRAVKLPDGFRGIKTAVASVLLRTPVLKHVMSICCVDLIDVSEASLQRHTFGTLHEDCRVAWVSLLVDMADLFLSLPTEELVVLIGTERSPPSGTERRCRYRPSLSVWEQSCALCLSVWAIGSHVSASRSGIGLLLG